jgi:hypothetical protein
MARQKKAERAGLTRANALGKHATAILEFFGKKWASSTWHAATTKLQDTWQHSRTRASPEEPSTHVITEHGKTTQIQSHELGE